LVFFACYKPALPDRCTLKETEYVSMFRDVGFIRTLADKEPALRLSQPSPEPEVDSGGEHGCVPERPDEDDDIMNTETWRVTRCSTTVCALTRYFCGPGAEVPSVEYYVGLSTLKAIINRRWESATASQHPRYFYRLSLGVVPTSKDADRSARYTGLSHVWLIAALGNGSFYWLQSFIMKYSLYTWLKEEGYYHLTREELFRRLDLVESLTTASTWTNVAEKHYTELFNVSMQDYWKMAEIDAAMMLRSHSRRFDPNVDRLFTIWDTVCSLTVVCKE